MKGYVLTEVTKESRASKLSPRIEQVALALFAARGLHGVSMPLIAEQAGVSAGTIYYQYGSKEGLANVLFRQLKRERLDYILHEYPYDAPFRHRFRRIVERFLGYVREHRDAFIFLEMHYHEDYLDEESVRVRLEAEAPFAQFFEKGKAQGLIRQDVSAARMTWLFTGALKGYLDGEWLMGSDWRQGVEEVEQCIWAMLRG